jgi:meso-butanediol dehydrogenase / (S,S)-butanediol dehydrogenase / diacetyl reductase
MMGRIENKVAIVTGSGSGIGAATAKLFAQEGAKVVVADIRAEAAEATAAGIRAAGGDAIAIPTDVSCGDQVKALMEKTVHHYGALHILHSNAGVLMPDTIESTTEDAWHRTMAVNVNGSYYCCRYGIPAMRASGGGAIVITSSTSGFQGEQSLCAYNTSKGALINLSRHLAVQHAKEGIRVNCICPGWVDTPFNDPVYETTGFDESSLDSFVPLGRQGTPEDIASSVLFLVSDEASYITGQMLIVDGGMTVI